MVWFITIGRYDAPAYFPPVIHNHCHCQKLPREVFVVPPVALVHGIHPRFNLNCYIPGFPSMRHLAHKVLRNDLIISFRTFNLYVLMIHFRLL